MNNTSFGTTGGTGRGTTVKLSTLIDLLVFFYIFTVGISVGAISNTLTNLIAVAIMGLVAMYELKKGTLQINGFIAIFFAFLSFCFISLLWSRDASVSWERDITVARLFVLSILMYDYLKSENKLDKYIKILCISGVCYALFILIYYGPTTYISLMLQGERAGDEIGVNSNLIGRIGAISTMLCLWKVLFEKKKAYVFGFLLCAFITLGSGSRTGFGGLFAGMVILFLFGAKGKKQIKFVILGLAFLLLLYMVLQLPMFSAISGRLNDMLLGVSDSEDGDASTIERLAMTRAAMEQFYETPFLGIGIGASGILTVSIMGISSYLHNNYMEMLASGGVVGTFIYYLFFLYPLGKLAANFKKRSKEDVLAWAVLISYMVMQMGTVLYFDKTAYVHLILLFLIAETTKKRRLSDGQNNKGV